MSELILHDHETVDSVFQLLGVKENDITRAIAWILKKCPSFLRAFLHLILKNEIATENIEIWYQRSEETDGIISYTDLEITDDNTFHVILEAKRGWNLPGREQLVRYANRRSFNTGGEKQRAIITVSECSQAYAKRNLPFSETANGIPIQHISWKELYYLSKEAYLSANHEQKRLLDEFQTYLKGLTSMQDQTSNRVYVVSLSNKRIEGESITWLDVVNRFHHYFCPFGVNGWPKEAPNYIGFRYNGCLQTIHHIEGYTITKNLHDVIDIMSDKEWDTDHFIFDLGPAIIPSKPVRTGSIYPNGRVWAMLDTLLTSDTISEARDISQERMKIKEY